MLKGSTTIQLFDGKTGKKEKECRNNNIVTNALSNILNTSFLLNTGSSNTVAYQLRNNLKNVYDNAMGGLLLFGDYHGENPNKIMPDSTNNIIGFAGNSTAYIDVINMRGNLNIDESKAIGNGYRMVWDFPTDKANGTIKTASLTSVFAGNTGGGRIFKYRDGAASVENSGLIVDADFKSSNNGKWKLPYPFENLPTSLGETNNDGGVVFYIKPLENGNLEMLYFAGGHSNKGNGDRCIYKLTYLNPRIIRPLYNSATSPYLLNKESISTPVYSNIIYNWSIWVDTQKEINITFSDDSYSSTTFYHKKYNLSGKLLSSKTVTLPPGSVVTSRGIGYYKDRYYGIYRQDGYGSSTSYKVVSFSASGQVISSSTTSNVISEARPQRFCFFTNQYTGELYVAGSGTYNSGNRDKTKYHLMRASGADESEAMPYFEYLDDWIGNSTWIENAITSPYIDGDIGINPPYFPLCYGQLYGQIYCNLNFRILSYYLATINDLDEPVTKKPTQTMRVTYELIEDGE